MSGFKLDGIIYFLKVGPPKEDISLTDIYGIDFSHQLQINFQRFQKACKQAVTYFVTAYHKMCKKSYYFHHFLPFSNQFDLTGLAKPGEI